MEYACSNKDNTILGWIQMQFSDKSIPAFRHSTQLGQSGFVSWTIFWYFEYKQVYIFAFFMYKERANSFKLAKFL